MKKCDFFLDNSVILLIVHRVMNTLFKSKQLKRFSDSLERLYRNGVLLSVAAGTNNMHP